MKNNFLIFMLLFFILFVFFTNSQDKEKEPSWIYLKRAENFKEKGDYAQAIIHAKKAKDKFIQEKLSKYYEEIRAKYKDKIEYELLTMTKEKEKELIQNDDYPQFHELMGDLYILTNLLDEAEKEYKKALSQSKFFEYPQKRIEILYKMAKIYSRKFDYELEDIAYREILKDFFKINTKEYWDRVKINIANDPSLNHVFRLYRINGTEYLTALYKVGRRAGILRKDSEALYYLSIAAIVWMTYYSDLIQKYNFDFQYSGPADFINYIEKKRIYEYQSEDYVMDEILFYIGYVYHLQKIEKLKNFYLNLAVIFSRNTEKEIDMKNRVNYLMKNMDHIITYEEIID